MPAELIGDVGDSRAGRRAENGIGCARWPSGRRDRASAPMAESLNATPVSTNRG